MTAFFVKIFFSIRIIRIKQLFFLGAGKGMRLKLKKIMEKRKGFTLLEVLLASLALAVVATLLFSLTTNAHLTTLSITGKIIAQNIAQATTEDIKAQNNYFLGGLINSSISSHNYPRNDGTVPGGYHIKTSSEGGLI